ncbi:MAG: hypothetical protein MUE33_08185 [Cytophagaceae bacterium]|jgi:hypothetical protein|nr:hypothetical protein [Cytophagaceae bacterium]
MKHLVFLSLFFSSSIVFSQCIDVQTVASQYLKDITTLTEDAFVKKYALSASDFLFIYNNLRNISDRGNISLSDSLKIRTEIYTTVFNSFRNFKEQFDKDTINLSSIRYETCFYELEYENEEVRIPILDDLYIHFRIDSQFFVIEVENLFLINNKWLGGRYQSYSKTDSNYEQIYSEYSDNYNYGYAVDSTAAVVIDTVAIAYDDSYYKQSQKVDAKGLKLQKKIDALNQKLNLLYRKQEEEMY